MRICDRCFQLGDDLRLHISIEGFDVRDFEAHIDARFAVHHGEELVMNEKFHANGTGHFAQTAWGGAFAMKSSMRKTTNETLRSLFEQFRDELLLQCERIHCRDFEPDPMGERAP